MLHHDPLAIDPDPASGPLLFDFTTAGREGNWKPVDDSVMGGASHGALEVQPRQGSFRGDLEAGSGGVASIRATPERPLDLSGAAAIELLARGDGRTYQLRVGDRQGRAGVRWVASFRPEPGYWRLVRVELDELVPTWRGGPAEGAAPLDRRAIISVGILLADGEPGAFRLDMRWIRAVR